MSNTQFVESHSSDPFVRDIARRVVRVLNDETLTREQRVRLVRRLQHSLIEYQEGLMARAPAVPKGSANREKQAGKVPGAGNAGVVAVLSPHRAREASAIVTGRANPDVPSENTEEKGKEHPAPTRKRPILRVKRA